MNTGKIPIIRTVTDLRKTVAEWKIAGNTVGLVPTMGALHHGHLSLVQAIAAHADKVIVSIFVNPAQFGKGEDLDTYPRDEEGDCSKLTATPCDMIYAPDGGEVYPPGFATSVRVSGITDDLEGAARPGHFDGVATVVSKLLNQTAPDFAIFGEKDYQQLALIRQFVRDMDMPVTILGGALIREADGLAASSRNQYLDKGDRAVAGQMNVILRRTVGQLLAGMGPAKAEENATKALLDAGFDAVDYVSVRDSETLVRRDNPVTGGRPARLLAVARIGGVRLLDNMAIHPES